MQVWEFVAKNFDGVNNKRIAYGDLLRLDIYISVLDYLEEQRPCFIKVTEDNNKEPDQDAKEEPMVSDLEEKAIKKRVLRKEKRDTQAALLAVSCSPGRLLVRELLSPSLSAVPGSSALSVSAVPVPGLSAPSTFAMLGLSALSMSTVFMPGLSAPSASAVPLPRLSAPFASAVHLPRLSAQSASTVLVLRLSALFASAMPVPGLSIPFVSALPLPRSFAPSGSAVPVPILSPPFPMRSSPQTPTPVSRKQRLGQ